MQSVNLLFDLYADRGGTGAISIDSDREAALAIGGGWHRHQGHCVREQVRRRVAFLQHGCKNHLLVAFTTVSEREVDNDDLTFKTRPDKRKTRQTCYETLKCVSTSPCAENNR